MKEILDFLTKSPAFYVATVDEDNRPRVRPFSFVMEWDGKLTFTTNTEKDIYRQLVKNPQMEICSFDPDSGEWMRIMGKIKFTMEREARKKVFEIMPDLKRIYQSEDNPIVTCFYIEEGEARIYSFSSMNDPVRTIKI